MFYLLHKKRLLLALLMLFAWYLRYNSYIMKWRRPLLLTALYVALPVFLLTTDPRDLPLPLLWVPFVLLFAVLFVSTRLVMRRRSGGPRSLSVAIIAATLPVLLLILASIDQLTIRDSLISAGLVIGGIWYLNRLDV